MANMNAKSYMSKLEEKGVNNYKVEEGEKGTTVRFSTELKSVGNVELVVFFNDDLSSASVRSWFIRNVASDKYAQMLLVCNDGNNKFKWARFYIDSDNDVAAQVDAIVTEDDVAEDMFELSIRCLSIIRDIYPEFMKAMWG